MSMKLKRKKILVIGGSGFIGRNFLNHIALKKLNYDIISPRHIDLDILNVEQLKKVFNVFCPEIVINFVAHRDANSAELQRNDLNGSAYKTNVKGTENLYKVCKEYASFLIHISTDMVFSGSKDNNGPYEEEDLPEKKRENLSWYGWTKAQGERLLRNDNKVAIIRIGNVTRFIYDPKLDYIGKILYLFDQGKLYSLFNDQYLTLTSISSLFQAMEIIIEGKKNGIFHVASRNIFTPYKLGEYLIKKARGNGSAIKDISIDEYLNKFPNRYSKYGGLLADKTAHELGIKLLNWEEIVDLFVSSLKK